MEYKINVILNIIGELLGLSKLSIHNFSEDSINKIYDIVNILNFDKRSEIIRIGNGSYSVAYKIRDKVLKIGMCKLNNRIFQNKNIITTLFKSNIIISEDNFYRKLGIEIQEYAEKINISTESLYDIYKDLRKNGIIWCDIKTENVGLYNGNIVVLDTDFLFYNNENIEFLTNLDKDFYIRYNENGGNINGKRKNS